MSLIKRIQQIERINALIRRKGTGTPAELAKKLNVSERTVYNLIDLMIRMGAPIYYCNERKSFCYEYDVEFSIGFLPKDIDKNKIKGGKNKEFLNFFSPLQNFCSDGY